MEERKGKINNRIRRSVYDLTYRDFEKEKNRNMERKNYQRSDK